MVKRKVVFASHDPGGFNLVFPIIKSFSAQDCFEVHLLLAGSALKRYVSASKIDAKLYSPQSFPVEQFPTELDVNQAEITYILESIQPDAIITGTSINSNILRYSIAFANKKDIPVLSIIDSWIGENVRFKSKFIESYPGTILVTDKAMEKRCSIFKDKNCKIVIVGNPHLEELHLQKSDRPAIRQQVQNRALFFSENIYHYYPDNQVNELYIIRSIVNNYSSNKPILLTIRPHPLESKNHWEQLIDNLAGLNPQVTIELDKIEDIFESIKVSNLCFGVSSMALIESSVIGNFTFSYQVDIEDKQMLYIPFDEYGIAEVKNIVEVCNILEAPEQFKKTYKKIEVLNSLKLIQDQVEELTT